MAVYKENIVDIDLAKGSLHRSFLTHTIGSGDVEADHFGVRVFRDGEPVDLTDVSVQGIFNPPQGSPIALTSGNVISGNVAAVVLKQACYNYNGQFCLSIKLVGGGVTGTMRIVDGMVDNTHSTGTVAPTEEVPTYQEVIAQYDAMVAATAAANGCIAETFDATKAYSAGKYVINSGALYRLTADHAANTTWANTSKVEVKFGNELSDVKSALYATTDRTGVDYQPSVNFTDGKGVKYSNGQLGTTSDRSCSDFIPISGYEKVVVTMGEYTSTTNYGIAFYTDATYSAYISGERETYNASSVGVEERTFEIPSTANYMRVSWFPSSSEYYSQFSCHLVKDGTLDAELAGMKAETTQSEEWIDDISDITGNDRVPEITFTNGKGVKYLDGGLGTIESRSYSNFINVEWFEKVVVTMGSYTSSTNYGIAFYTNNNSTSFISGVRETYNASSVGVETRTFNVPATAKYMRLTWFSSSSEFYSQFSCHLVKKGSLDDKLDALVNVVTENALNKSTITSGKFINKSGSVGTSDSYSVTDYIAVKKNDVVKLMYDKASSASTMRYVTAYNASKSVVSDSGAENVSSYTVPTGIAYVRISASKTILDSTYPRISLNGEIIKYESYYSGLTSGLAKNDHTNLELFRNYPLSALPEYFVNNLAYKPLGQLSKGYICLVSDDGDSELATYTVPMLIAKNVPATFAVMQSSECWEDDTNKATILDAVTNHGCCIAQHGGTTWDQYDELTLNRFFDKEKEFWDSLGVTVYGAVCPQHRISNMIKAVSGGRFGCLRSGYNYGTVPYPNYTNGARSNLYGLCSQSSLDGTLGTQSSILDYCKENNLLRIIHWHENEMSAADKTMLEGIIDYAKSIEMTFVTMKDIPDIT